MSKHRVYETGVTRSWTPEMYASQERIGLVLDIILDHGVINQKDIAELLWDELHDLKIGTVRGIVSAALLYLKESGLVENTSEGKSTEWKISDA